MVLRTAADRLRATELVHAELEALEPEALLLPEIRPLPPTEICNASLASGQSTATALSRAPDVLKKIYVANDIANPTNQA
jgi:hypothetical protein